MIFRIFNWFIKEKIEKKEKELLCGWAMGFSIPAAMHDPIGTRAPAHSAASLA
jgi:hypothetical protein